MYSIQFSDWGLVFEFIGPISPDMMRDWLTDVRQLTGGFIEPFSVIVDVQRARPDEYAVEELLLEGLFALERVGLERVAVIVDEEGDVRWPRFRTVRGPAGLRRFVARPRTNWLVQVHAWVQHGIDPEADEATTQTDP